MNPEELEKLKQYKASIESSVSDKLTAANTKMLEVLEEKINKAIEDVEKKLKEQKAVIIPGLDDELKKKDFSFAKFVKATAGVPNGANTDFASAAFDKADAGYEREILASHKGYLAGSGSLGGYMIPDEVSDSVIEAVIAKTPIMNKFEITSHTGLKGDLHLPIETSQAAVAVWLGETGTLTEGTGELGEVVLRPKKIGTFSKVSNRLLSQSGNRAESYVREQIIVSMALGLNLGLLSGSGSSAQPQGIINAGIGTLTNQATNGARLRIDKAAAMQMFLDVLDEYGDDGSYGLLIRPEGLGGMKRERVVQYSGQAVGDGQPLTADFILQSEKQLAEALGFPIATTTQLSKAITKGTSSTCSHGVFGNWKQYNVGFWRGLEMMVSEHASDASGNSAFLRDQIFIRAIQEIDGQVGRKTAFVLTSDIETLESAW